MSQISPPIRILVVCAVALMAAWMLVLKPKPDAGTPPTAAAPNVETGAPAVSTPGELVEAAQETVDGAPATGTATGAQPAPAQGSATAKPATSLKDVPKPVAKAIRQEKVLALLFWNGESADDRAVRTELRDVNRWNGRVHVHAAPLKKVSDYGRITRGVDLSQSPTVVVVDPELRAQTLVGYVDTQTIDQAVLDALRNSTGMFTSTYLREINSVCARFADAIWAMPSPQNEQAVAAYVASARNKAARFGRDFKSVAAPKKFRGLKRATVRDNAAMAALYAEWATFLGRNPSTPRIVASVGRFADRERAITKRYNRRMDAQNVLSCGSQA